MFKISYLVFEVVAMIGCLTYLQSKGITFWGSVTVFLTALVWKIGGYMEERK